MRPTSLSVSQSSVSMGLDKLLVVLDHAGAFSPGDVVQGKVVVGLSTEKKVREICVKLQGTSEVCWSERHRRSNRGHRTRRYRASESHVDTRVTLLGGAGQELLLPPGEHIYHFQTQLPPGIPPSFEGDHGHVRYRVKAQVDRPWRRDDKAEVDLLVLALVDLNLQPALREPARGVREKTLCCCWCKSGPLTLLVHTPSTGFVPGQNVSVSVEVDNETGRRVDNVRCSLKKKVQYEARTPSRKVKRTEAKMASLEMGSVEARKPASWTRVLALPQGLPPSGLPHCGIIQVDYCLVVKAEVSGMHLSPTVEIPVVVGTVPLTAVATSPVVEPSAPPQASLEAPPPSYEESVYGAISYLPPQQTKYDHLA